MKSVIVNKKVSYTYCGEVSIMSSKLFFTLYLTAKASRVEFGEILH
jgi:hypothetical protein